MMRYKRIRFIDFAVFFIGMFLWSPGYALTPVTLDDCRPLVPASRIENSSLVYSNALLWKIKHDNASPSFIFGTIHVADERITTLPAVIRQTLLDSRRYVMEALPDPAESYLLTQMMTFTDGNSLRDYLGEQLLNRTQAILANYGFTQERVLRMKPWAAFLFMNYPAEKGLPLDFQMLQLARENGAQLHGLETLSEQGEIFANMSMEKQLQLLLDTACNYDTVKSDFEVMKSYYLQRDLRALYQYSTRYSVSSEALYTELLEKLLLNRNKRMVERLFPLLEEGNAFIAVGAMHLPGDEGILSLLANHGYSITPIY